MASVGAVLSKTRPFHGYVSLTTTETGVIGTPPLLRPLAASIAATKTGDLTFIVSDYGRAFTMKSFGNWFRDVCRQAGVQKSAHGLRRAGAARAAENGATEHQLMAMFGWTTTKQAAHYTKAASRRRMGIEGGATLLMRKKR